MTRKLTAYAAGLMACSAFTAPAMAQDAEQPAEELQAPSDNVIIVTATRRAQDVQDIPLAVTAVGPEQLQQQGVNEIRDVTAVAPSFSSTTAQTAAGSVVLRVRGVGTTSNNIGFESAVGIFIDGAYQSRPGVALGEFVDIERVEVLRGPQGTLFGRNTSAGALNITTVRPDLGEFGGFANATYGRFDEIGLQGAINVPIVQDTLALRLTGAYRERDGAVTVVDAAGNAFDDTNDIDRYLLRGQIGWETESGFRGRIMADYSNNQSSAGVAVQVFETPLSPFFPAVGLGATGGQPTANFATTPFDQAGFDQAAQDRTVAANFAPVADVDNWGVLGEFEYPISDSADVIFIASYREFDALEFYDSDFSAIDSFNVQLDTQIDTFTAELRFQGEAFDGRVNWLFGGYYSDEQIEANNSFFLADDFGEQVGFLFAGLSGGATLGTLGPNPLSALTGGLDPAGSTSTNRFTQSAESWSIFTHNTFEITDGLEFTVGARYYDESKSGGFEQVSNVNSVCPTFAGALLGGALPPLGALQDLAVLTACFGFTAPADLPAAAVLPLPLTFQDTFDDDELIYTLKLGYEITSDVSTYASFTHGIKAGGINLDTTAGVFGADPTFESEEVDAYEVGIKSRFLDDAVTLNVAAFHQEFTNFQVLEFTGAAFQSFNVPEALTTGIEIEGVIRPSPNWTFNLGTTILDARYPDDCAGDLTSVTVLSLCGNDLTNAAELTAIAGALYETEISDNLDFFASGQVRFVSDERTSTQAIVPPSQGATVAETQAAIDAAPLIVGDVQDSNIKINLRAGIGSPDDTWALEFYVLNVTNEVTRGVTFNNVLRGVGAVNARSSFILEPRTYGATLRTRF
ncbi:MAG: TonB-dependent receptor [Pseudomonadota bacterium]